MVFGDAVIPPLSAGPLAGLTRELSFGACRRGPESRRVSCLTAITPCRDDVAVLLRRDEHVLVSTRLLALVIIPFLLGAFVILYGFPRHTARKLSAIRETTMWTPRSGPSNRIRHSPRSSSERKLALSSLSSRSTWLSRSI